MMVEKIDCFFFPRGSRNVTQIVYFHSIDHEMLREHQALNLLKFSIFRAVSPVGEAGRKLAMAVLLLLFACFI